MSLDPATLWRLDVLEQAALALEDPCWSHGDAPWGVLAHLLVEFDRRPLDVDSASERRLAILRYAVTADVARLRQNLLQYGQTHAYYVDVLMRLRARLHTLIDMLGGLTRRAFDDDGGVGYEDWAPPHPLAQSSGFRLPNGTVAMYRRADLDVACPYCGAKPDQLCMTSGGNTCRPHRDREHAADALLLADRS